MNYKRKFYKYVCASVNDKWNMNIDLQSQYFNSINKKLKFINIVSFICMLFFYMYLFMVLTFQRSNIVFYDKRELLSVNAGFMLFVLLTIVALNVYFVLRRMNFIIPQFILGISIIIFTIPNLIGMMNFDDEINEQLAGITLHNTSEHFKILLILYVIFAILFLTTLIITFRVYLKQRRIINDEYDRKYNALYKKALLKNGSVPLTDAEWNDYLSKYLESKESLE